MAENVKAIVFEISVDPTSGLVGLKQAEQQVAASTARMSAQSKAAAAKLAADAKLAASPWAQFTSGVTGGSGALMGMVPNANLASQALGMAGVAGAGLLAVTAVTKGVAAIKNFTSECLSLGKEALAAEGGLRRTFVAMGQTADQAKKSQVAFSRFSTEMMKQTVLADEQVMALGKRIALMANVSGKELETLVKVSIAVGQQRGRSAEAIAPLVARTYSGTTNALQRIGVQLDMTKSKSEQLDEMVLKTQRGWRMATTEVLGLSGSQKQLAVSSNEVKESMGKWVWQIPQVKETIQALTAFNFANADAVRVATERWGEFAGTIIDVTLPALRDAIEVMKGWGETLRIVGVLQEEGAKKFSVASELMALAGTTVGKVWGAATPLGNWISQARTLLDVFNLIGLAVPPKLPEFSKEMWEKAPKAKRSALEELDLGATPDAKQGEFPLTDVAEGMEKIKKYETALAQLETALARGGAAADTSALTTVPEAGVVKLKQFDDSLQKSLRTLTASGVSTTGVAFPLMPPASAATDADTVLGMEKDVGRLKAKIDELRASIGQKPLFAPWEESKAGVTELIGEVERLVNMGDPLAKMLARIDAERAIRGAAAAVKPGEVEPAQWAMPVQEEPRPMAEQARQSLPPSVTAALMIGPEVSAASDAAADATAMFSAYQTVIDNLDATSADYATNLAQLTSLQSQYTAAVIAAAAAGDANAASLSKQAFAAQQMAYMYSENAAAAATFEGQVWQQAGASQAAAGAIVQITEAMGSLGSSMTTLGVGGTKAANAFKKIQAGMLLVTGIVAVHEGAVVMAKGFALAQGWMVAAGALEVAKGMAAVAQAKQLGASGGGGGASAGAGGGVGASTKEPQVIQGKSTAWRGGALEGGSGTSSRYIQERPSVKATTVNIYAHDSASFETYVNRPENRKSLLEAVSVESEGR